MRLHARILGLAAAAAATAMIVSAADARPRYRLQQGERLIVVKPRSFLDSGVVVPRFSRSVYMQEMTIYNRQPLERTSPGLLWRPEPGMTGVF